ncbi:MAG: hypothetical protein OXK77_17535 [Gemmatimonadota bacterium]|nr:hypothetical protein [Gemmatimonadota bacterium]MDE2865584.1 hypothetical protein [Gemmatimonadota bacterium]
MKAIISAGVGALGMFALAGLVSGAEATPGEMPSAAVAQDTPVVQQTPPVTRHVKFP